MTIIVEAWVSACLPALLMSSIKLACMPDSCPQLPAVKRHHGEMDDRASQ